jgi:phosphatidylglycerophosphate synthase
VTEATPTSRALALIARGLTLSRLALLPPFLWLLYAAATSSSPLHRVALAGCYGFIALSDALDGRLARRARAATQRWARLDAAADILFNLSALAAASHLGWMGAWVPAGVALLGGRFLWRIVGDTGNSSSHVREDRAGKAAGVLYYALVGWVVIELSTGGVLGRSVLGFGADAVFGYTLLVLWLGRGSSSSGGRRITKST